MAGSRIVEFKYEKNDFMSVMESFYAAAMEVGATADNLLVVVMSPRTVSDLVKCFYSRWHIWGKDTEETVRLNKEFIAKEEYFKGVRVVPSYVMKDGFLHFIFKE